MNYKSLMVFPLLIYFSSTCSENKTFNDAVLSEGQQMEEIIEVDDNPSESEIDYRNEMRNFVIRISSYAKDKVPDFAVIPQNGIELVTKNGLVTGDVESDYMAAINGNGQESLFYGEPNDNRKTPNGRTKHLTGFLDISKNQGNTIFTTDYCSTKSKVNDSKDLNTQKGYISFQANQRELSSIPTYPENPNEINDKDILQLNSVKNFLYILNYNRYNTKTEFLTAMENTNYDMLLIDAFFNDGTVFTREEVERLKIKSIGGKRLVVSYMSIGEAEDYRYYWDLNWEFDPPEWLDDENKKWAGNYKVKYWLDDWQKIMVSDSDDSYLNILIDAGFDGVYLDIIDAYNFFELK